MLNEPTIFGHVDNVTFKAMDPCREGRCGCSTCNHSELDGKEMPVTDAMRACGDHDGCGCLMRIMTVRLPIPATEIRYPTKVEWLE